MGTRFLFEIEPADDKKVQSIEVVANTSIQPISASIIGFKENGSYQVANLVETVDFRMINHDKTMVVVRLQMDCIRKIIAEVEKIEKETFTI